MNKKYNCGLLYYGSIYNDTIDNNLNIIEGPVLNIRLAGLSHINTPKEKLARIIDPNGYPVKSSIILFNTDNLKKTFQIILKREYYKGDDNGPLCYLKKNNNEYSINISYYESNYIKEFNKDNIKKLLIDLKEYSKKFNLDYIFFINYSNNIKLLNIDNNLDNYNYNKELIKLFISSKHLFKNTIQYLFKCDPNTYSSFDRFLIRHYYFIINI